VKTVLIVDSDLGFVLWLGRILYDAGYEAFPATGVREATALTSEFEGKIDLLIVNPSLVGAIDLVDSLRRAKGDLKVLALLDEDDQQPSSLPNADAHARKPPEGDEAASRWWLGIVGRLLFLDCAA
jgi:DNA-binding response OmpR family regulator